MLASRPALPPGRMSRTSTNAHNGQCDCRHLFLQPCHLCTVVMPSLTSRLGRAIRHKDDRCPSKTVRHLSSCRFPPCPVDSVRRDAEDGDSRDAEQVGDAQLPDIKDLGGHGYAAKCSLSTMDRWVCENCEESHRTS